MTLIERSWTGDAYTDSDERPKLDRRSHPHRMYPFAARACPPLRFLDEGRPRRFRYDGTPNPAYERDMARWREERGL